MSTQPKGFSMPAFDITATFKDVHHIQHTDGVIEVYYVDRRISERMDGPTEGTLNVNARHWTNQQAKDDGAEPLDFRGAGNKRLTKQISGSELTDPINDVARAFIENEILPELQA